MPTPPAGSAHEYAAFLEDCLRHGLKIEPPADFRSLFAFHATRLGAADYEDLGSLVLLECQQILSAGESIDRDEVRRIVDRVRHRIIRKAKRETSLEFENELSSQPSMSPIQAEKALREFTMQLSPIEAIIFDQRCLEGRSVQDIADETGHSPATIYRILATVRAKFEQYLASR